MLEDAVVVAMTRTAVGRMGGGLADVRAIDLATFIIKEVMKKVLFDPEEIDELIMGNVENRSNDSCLARGAGQLAGLPLGVPGYVINKLCGSSLKAIHTAADQIRVGRSSVMLAGGVENMSEYRFAINRGRYGYRLGSDVLVDTLTEVLADNPDPLKRPAAQTAENLAAKYDISREDQDLFAYTSQKRAVEAIEKGRFKDEITPIEVKKGKQSIVFDTDEHPRPGTTMEGLAKLRPIIKDGTVTAGNACGINDGASIMILMSEKKAQALNLKPIAKVRGYAGAGVQMDIFGIGPVPAIKKSTEMAGISVGDLGLIEINEAFAAQVIACEKEMGLDHEIVNVNGGAIAHGHAIGNTGTRISITLLQEMLRRKTKYGVSSACIGSGLGVAVVWENL
ncbi:MAG: thiolase family protein, partial [Desulfobacterales bacterium]